MLMGIKASDATIRQGKKIILSSNIFGDGGPAIRGRAILKILKGKYNVTLVARITQKDELECIKNVNIVTIEQARIKFFDLLNLIPTIMRNNIDYIYCVSDWRGFIIYYLLSKFYRYKIIFEAHYVASEFDERQKRPFMKFRHFYEKFVIKHADHVIAVGDNIVKSYGRYNKNISLIPLFVDTNMFKKNEISKSKVKNGSKNLGLIGPFTVPNKYTLEFLYENISAFNQKIKFAVIGKCDYKIENARISYTGYLDSIQDYISQLQALDAVLAIKSIEDYGPLTKIIESMSCSLPVFTIPDCVIGMGQAEHGKNIFVFEEDKIVDKINELIFDDELMKEIGRNARVTVERYYSKKANEMKLVEVLESLWDEGQDE